MARQDFTGGFPQADGAERENKQGRIENKSHQKHSPTRNHTYAGTQDKLIKSPRGLWIQIDLKVPTQRQ